MTTVYLAGPGVFRPDALQFGAQLKEYCALNGLTGLFPLDQAAPTDLAGDALSKWIFNANCALIRRADVVLADVSAFRSTSEPDSGTAFEIGFAYALGKPVYLWLPDVPANSGIVDRVGGAVDENGWQVEDFGAPLNLMLWQAATELINVPSAAEAIEILAKLLIKTQ